MSSGAIGAVALLALSLAFVACSSGSGSGGGGGGGGNITSVCQSTCDTMAALACPNDDVSTCMSDCQDQLSQYAGECESAVSGYFGCIVDKGLKQCGPDGKAHLQAPASGCESQKQAVSSCAACLPSASDSPSVQCMKQSCCSELKAFGNAPNIQAYSDCVGACSTSSCIDACNAQYPQAGQAFDATLACEAEKC